MVGIGGSGLSALAQLYVSGGSRVSGSDLSDSPIMEMLRQKGIKVYVGQEASQVPEDANLLVYSDAVPGDNPERVHARELGILQMSYFEALGEAASGYRVIAIAGTHGKTTVTAMLGKILVDAGVDPTIIVGSVVPEWGSNFREGTSNLLVVEACEYREHFLNFRPEILVVTNIEFDHSDYFKNIDHVYEVFGKMKSLTKEVIDKDLYSKERVPDLIVLGEFNKENAQAAKSAARVIAPHILEESIDKSLANFKGVWRRFEYKGVLPNGAKLYDDYAHHPTAIFRTVTAMREKFPDKKIAVLFQPHLYSRTRDFFYKFANALALADKTFVLPIYASRETKDSSITNDALVKEINKIGGNAQTVEGLDAAEEVLINLGSEVVVLTMGAGDVYKVGEKALLLNG